MSEEAPTPIWQYHSGAWKEHALKIPAEADVTLSVNGEAWLSFACTPHDLKALAAGFLFNEGVIESAEEIASLMLCENGSHIDVWLSHAAARPVQWRRTSGCTGGSTAASASVQVLAQHAATFQLTSDQVMDAMQQLFNSQSLYREARGIHCAGLSDGSALRVVAEDIGRHNTLDKLSGALLLNPMNLERRVLLTTGRVSSEMLQKAVRIGAEMVISHTSPTLRSVSMAEQTGITLIGYARRGEFIMYTCPQRVTGAPLASR